MAKQVVRLKGSSFLLACILFMLSLRAVGSNDTEPKEAEVSRISKNIPELKFNDNYNFGFSVLIASRFSSNSELFSREKFQTRIVRFTPTFSFNQANWICQANYRFYLHFNAVRNAYCEHHWNNNLSLAIGVLPTLIGRPGYSDSSFWGSLPFYYGVQGDNDLGSYLTISRKHWDLKLGYYFSDEYGDGSRLERSTFDSVNTPQSTEKESGALAGRWTFHANKVDLYVSAQQQKTEQNDGSPARERRSLSFDQTSSFSSWRLNSTLGYYKFSNHSNPNAGPPFIGAFTGRTEIAPSAQYAVIRLVKFFDSTSPRLGQLSCYAELSVVRTHEKGFNNGRLAVVGCKKDTKNYTVYFDLIRARNVIAVSTFDSDFLRRNTHSTELQIVLNLKIF